MTANLPANPASTNGGRRPDRRPGKGQRAAARNARDVTRAGTRYSTSSDRTAILGWSLAFVVIAVVVVGAAVVLSQSNNGSAGVNSPTVVTPSNIPTNGRTLGPASAPVTIDIYGDFRCSACLIFTTSGTEANLVNNYIAPGKARLVWHDRTIIDELTGGTNSRAAANAAMCAADQGKFWTVHDWLYANSAETTSAFSPAILSEIGQKAGLDMTKYQPCIDSGTHIAEVVAENASEQSSINSTPTLYVNGRYVGASGQLVTYDQLKAAIDAALAAPASSPSPAAAAS
jgi:protein-disulfide isomerase